MNLIKTHIASKAAFLIFFLFLISYQPIFGQKLLQIEKLHSPKTRKYFQGNEITFQVKGGEWYTRVIEDVNYEKQYLLFSNGHIKVEDVIAIKSFKNKKWSKSLGNQLIFFAPVWAVYTLIATAVDDELKFGYGKGDYIVMGSSIGTGALLRVLFKSRTFKFQKDGKESTRWRLRILDLDIKRGDVGGGRP